MSVTTSASQDESLIESAMAERHRALGAKFGPFAGWSMPLEYAGYGVAAEHTAVRSTVGLFDVSHLGTAVLRGAGAVDLLNTLFTNDLAAVNQGRAQYTLLCQADGGVIDDLIVYRRDDDDVLLIPNAANSAEVLAVIADAIDDLDESSLVLTDVHREMAIIAVQGPLSAEVLAAVSLPASMPYLAFVDAKVSVAGHGPIGVTICRTGYTGEHGYEVLVPADHASALWDALWDAVSERGGAPCGLAARDTLRTEMGYPLHGNDISRTITPVQAGLTWAVGWDKPIFIGRDALIAERAEGPSRRLRGLRLLARGVPRPGMTVRNETGDDLGIVTSGTYSPTLATGIALALLPAEIALGGNVVIDARGRDLSAEVVKPPFVDASPR